ncbi:hypothetical protein SAMD00019534_019790 [Acytostelium subglobosum LB1]|uniref:hypothetical protein n=1 Tax=Acytostelium subglobosum LB1 TaxID=1410327 RepID=UPI000644A637|nr:hypothetical protein SAMD00019534_019790 [Acytostelium subglobosum LB1]GAM18804.1 hypothetical protein SAMD00019534_019790 [Acytostelium subglobosum LB1]|eukprot:XP_012758024.1 hypothetical protein SAMD00019534_019790 [Acytostelium subglobosum LB1]
MKKNKKGESSRVSGEENDQDQDQEELTKVQVLKCTNFNKANSSVNKMTPEFLLPPAITDPKEQNSPLMNSLQVKNLIQTYLISEVIKLHVICFVIRMGDCIDDINNDFTKAMSMMFNMIGQSDILKVIIVRDAEHFSYDQRTHFENIMRNKHTKLAEMISQENIQIVFMDSVNTERYNGTTSDLEVDLNSKRQSRNHLIQLLNQAESAK